MADIFYFDRGTDIGDLYSLAMAYIDPPNHDYLICEGDGHYVTQRFIIQ